MKVMWMWSLSLFQNILLYKYNAFSILTKHCIKHCGYKTSMNFFTLESKTEDKGELLCILSLFILKQRIASIRGQKNQSKLMRLNYRFSQDQERKSWLTFLHIQGINLNPTFFLL